MGVRPITADMVEAWLRGKYTQHADARQKKMGLDYTTVETKDLARELARCVNEYWRLELVGDLTDFTEEAKLFDL